MRSKLLSNKKSFLIGKSVAILLISFISMYAFGQNVKWREKGSNRNANFFQVKNDFKQYWSGRTPGKGKGYKVFQRWENYMAPRVFPSGNMALPSTNYAKFISWQQNNPNVAARTNSSLTTGNWTEIGPLSKPTGYDAGVGRIDFIEFNPTNNNIAYVSTPDGGLWKTTNAGAPLPSWTTNADFLPVIGCSELSIAPNGTTMYLATGSWESDKRSAGILKSTDGGTTWSPTSLTFSAVDGYFIRRLQMDPTNPLIMLAATDGGIFRTTDGWATNSLTNLDGNYNIQDIKFKPTDHNTLYASGKTGLNTSVFYKSTNNGITWAAVTAGLPLSTDVSRIILAVAPSNPTYVYALAGNNDGGYKGLYRSTNSGASFTTQSTTPNILNTNVPEDGPGGQANHDLAIAVSPSDPNTVTIGGISQWRSTNGGVNWSLLTYWYGEDPLYPGQGSRPEPYIHADVQTIKYLPGSSTTLFTSSDGGIYRSTDNGVSWTDISNNIRVSQETDVANSAANAGIFIVGLQDIGNLKNTNGAFTYIGGGDGESAFIDRTNDLNIVTSDPNGNHRLSKDGGNSFTTLNGNGLPEGTEFFSPIIQDPITATTCYAGGRPALYKSTNFLSAPSHTWAAIGTPSGTGSVTRFVIYPGNSQIIYTLKEDAVSKTINGGATWTNITGTLPVGNARIRNITVSNTNPNKVWVVFSGYSAGDKVFKTIDGGVNWTNVNSTGLPNIPINTIVYRNNSTNDEVYIGADIGVYIIDNTMASWAPYFTGLARSTVNDLEIFYPTNKLRAATYGRGTWESDLNTAVVNYTITASAGANGTITPSGAVSVASGTSQTFTIAANPCYQRATVLVDGVNNPSAVSSGTYTFTNVTAPHTISATFSQLTYVITANAGANGTITPNGATTVNCGASQTYTITPNSGFTIQNVTVDGVSEGAISSRTFTNVTAPHTISATFNAVANTVVYRINSGGGQVTNSIGVFAADAFFSPTPGNTHSTAMAIAGTADDAIYQTERFSSTGTLNYAFPVTNGQYSVILHFAEIFYTGIGARVFDVSLEGTKLLDNYDIFKKVGAYTATTESLSMNVTDGTLNLYFSSLAADGGVNNPKVSAIEIIRTSTNLAPVANAGADQSINLPVSSTTLNGSGTDADGMISGYTWSQISGPNTATFSNTSVAMPTVSGLVAGNYWFSLVVTDNQMAVSAPDQVLVAVNAAGNTVVYRINSGGGQVTNTIGVFAADAFFSPTPGNTHSTAMAIAGTADDAIYQTERFSSTGTLNYAFPVTNGQYSVILHFAEIFYTGIGARVFDVSLEGTKLLDNYDIFKKVGAYTATTESLSMNVTDGTLNLYFSSLAADGGVNNPKVSAIEIIRTSTNLAPVANAGADQSINLPVSSTTLNGSGTDADGMISGYTWSQISGPNTATFSNTSVAMPTVSGLVAGNYWFSLVVTDNQMAVSAPDQVLVAVNAAGNTVVYRINSGGGQVTNTIGVFAADAFFSPTPGNTHSTAMAIAGTADDAIYQTERFSSTGTLNYAFPVTNGQYRVILHFAEIFYTGIGARVFDVSLEGTKLLDNFDIVKKVGAYTATTESFSINVTDGTLNVYFSSLAADGGANNPKVSAIEVIRISSGQASGVETALSSDYDAANPFKKGLMTKLKVKVNPNPALDYFTLHITSRNSRTVFVSIFSTDGRLIESKRNIAPNSVIQFGSKYIPGLYYAEVLQGKEKVTLPIIKLKN